MKTTINKVSLKKRTIFTILVLMFTMVMQVSSYAQDPPPPPPPGGGSDPSGGGGQTGGGAPVGSGLLILMGLGGCYGGYKLYKKKQKSLLD